MRRPVLIVLATCLLGAMALAVAGCGSKKASSTPPKSSAGSVSTTTTTPTEAMTTTTTPTAAMTTTTPVSGSPTFDLLTNKNCQQLVGLSQAFASALGGSGKNLVQAAAVIKQFADKAPSDIRPSFEVLADAYAKIASALNGNALSSGQAPSPAEIAKLEQLSTEIDTAKVSQAGEKITAWATKNCTTK